MQDLSRQGVQELMARGAQIVEVLGPDEFDEDHLPGAINIPLRRLEKDGPERLDKGQPVVLYCWDSA